MFSFSKNNETLTINEIDEIAAHFWGKEVSKTRYATPVDKSSVNWFDVLGHAIEDLQYGKTTYNDKSRYVWSAKRGENPVFSMPTVASMIIFQFTRNEDNFEDIAEMTKILEPFIKLCYHLHSLGITAEAYGW